MALTEHCDVFACFHEDGFNRIINHIQLQRPSLFNYGTEDIIKNEKLRCQPIEAHSAVGQYNNPLITASPYLPIPGYSGPFGMSYIMQLTKLKIDFHPSNTIVLPNELNPPLKDQHLALSASFCVGMGCPDKRYIDEITLKDQDKDDKREQRPVSPERGFPFRKLNCFCLDILAVLHIDRTHNYIELKLDGLEIVDIKPEGLENILECYIETIIRLSLLPKLRMSLNKLVFEIENYVTIQPTPISANVPFNPSVAKDKVSVFVNLN